MFVNWRLTFCAGNVLRQFRQAAPKAFADRLPQAVLAESRVGYQAADWHEGLTAVHGHVVAELERLAACPPAARALNIEKMKGLTQNWPAGDWESSEIVSRYRLALLRGISGHFLRKTSGAN